MPAPTALLDFLAPPPPATAEAGLERREERLLTGVPHSIVLDAEVSLVLIVPTGLAATWRDADPAALVTTSADEVQATAGASETDSLARAPARLLVRHQGHTRAAVPLVAGVRWRAPNMGASGAGSVVELQILGWEIHAGTMRGPGDFGSRLDFAWRRADRPVERFSTPPVIPQLVPRLPPEFRAISVLGVETYTPLPRFTLSPRRLRL